MEVIAYLVLAANDVVPLQDPEAFVSMFFFPLVLSACADVLAWLGGRSCAIMGSMEHGSKRLSAVT